MHLLDWILVALPLALVAAILIGTRRYMKGVAGFLSGGRVANRYLLAVAKGEAQSGAVVFVAIFEMIARAGFTTSWWNWIMVPAMLIVAISGFVIYRFRETRAMTLAQFFELRYSRSFRLFAGVLAFGAGILNFGIIPAVGTRFFVYFLQLPPTFTLLSFEIPTYIPLMGLFLAISLTLTLWGGFVSLLVTDCVEGILSQIFYLIIIASVLALFTWPQIAHVLSDRPPGHSMLNPFDALAIRDFNLWYVLMGAFVTIYGTMAWQNASAYNSAARTPHESRMGGVLGRWRELGKMAVITLLAIFAVTFMQHPDFAAQAAPAKAVVDQIGNPQLQEQMRVPVMLSYLLPIGIKGLLCVVLLMGVFGGDSTHLHSWGSIFVQDVIVPLRKKPLTPEQHIRLLRFGIAGVAVFAFLFGSLFQQTEYVLMWWQVTQAVFVGGAGAAIIGGLYWKKGTTAGAWTAILTGSILSVGGILARQTWGRAFPLNGMEVSFYATLIAITAYVVVSLLTHRRDFDMDRMLHRGAHALPDPTIPATPAATPTRPRRRLLGRLIGLDENYTRADTWIAGGLFAWSAVWFTVMLVGTIWNLLAPWPTAVWAAYWRIAGYSLPALIVAVTAVWFTWGGLRDLRDLFRRLRDAKANPLDNGVVVDGRNLDEAAASLPPRAEAAKLLPEPR